MPRSPFRASSFQPPASSRRPRRGFTLTELLIVIAIIGVLASLIAAASINALRNARRARITLEMKQMAAALADLKNEVGAYPPNVFPIGDPPSGLNVAKAGPKNLSDLKVFLSKVSNQSSELQGSSNPTTGTNNISPLSNYGLSPAEALVFWLQGFSQDVQRPLSGDDLRLTEVADDDGKSLNITAVTIDSFKPRYDFDRQRLRISKNANGQPRYLTFYRANGDEVRVLLYQYLPAGSEKPYAYFDTSRYTPYQAVNALSMEFYMSDDTGKVLPLKQLKPNTPTGTTDARKLQYVEQGKFQIVHTGLDDAWGNFGPYEYTGGNLTQDLLLFPDGPFVGDVADTLTSYTDGTIGDAQENE